jgi:hypothetical protein
MLVRVNGAVIVALTGAMALLVFANVVARYVFNHSFTWAEELSRYMMVWVGFLGAGLVLRVGAHIAVDVVQDLSPLRAAQALRVCVVAVLAAALLAMSWLKRVRPRARTRRRARGRARRATPVARRTPANRTTRRRHAGRRTCRRVAARRRRGDACQLAKQPVAAGALPLG